MKDEQRSTPDAERVKDLDVSADEAGDVAGGKQKEPWRYGKAAGKKAGKSSAGIRHGKSAT